MEVQADELAMVLEKVNPNIRKKGSKISRLDISAAQNYFARNGFTDKDGVTRLNNGVDDNNSTEETERRAANVNTSAALDDVPAEGTTDTAGTVEDTNSADDAPALDGRFTITPKDRLISEIRQIATVGVDALNDENNFGFFDDAVEEFNRKCYELKAQYYPHVLDYGEFSEVFIEIKDAVYNDTDRKLDVDLFFYTAAVAREKKKAR